MAGGSVDVVVARDEVGTLGKRSGELGRGEGRELRPTRNDGVADWKWRWSSTIWSSIGSYVALLGARARTFMNVNLFPRF
jgi:hypothetical protein